VVTFVAMGIHVRKSDERSVMLVDKRPAEVKSEAAAVRRLDSEGRFDDLQLIVLHRIERKHQNVRGSDVRIFTGRHW
jgi:hypothetical protein